MSPALLPPHTLGSQASGTQIPCWPNPTRLVLLLTRGVDRVTGNLMIQIPFVFAAVFALDNVLGRVLHLIGYDGLFLFQHQYAYHSARIPRINIVDFQLYEFMAVLSAAIWGARLLLGIIFLKEYDRFFIGVSKNYDAWKLYFLFFLSPIVAYVPIDMSTAVDANIALALLIGFPRIYFSFMSVILFWALWMIASSLLFVIWKLFRQHWPWATLCPENPQARR